MAEQFIEDIYQYSNTLTNLELMLSRARSFDTNYISESLSNLNDDFRKFCQAFIDYDQDAGNRLLQAFAKLKSTDDIVFFADILESQIIPLAYEFTDSLSSIDVELNDTYSIISSKSGYLSIRNNKTGRYLNSAVNPMLEAYKYVNEFYLPSKTNYVVFGADMGYIAYQLYKMSLGSCQITVFENDSELLGCAMNYGVLTHIPQDNLNTVCDSDIMTFLNLISKDENYPIFHVPSIDALQNPVEREAIFSMFISRNTERTTRTLRITNFWSNHNLNIPDASTLKPTRSLEPGAAVVAAGPSLDLEIQTLKDMKAEGVTIVCVGTVLKKLLKVGIEPDYVVVTDPFEVTYNQFKGIDNYSPTLVLYCCAYWKVANTYKGNKYIVYNCSSSDSDIYAVAKDYPTFDWGRYGTVTGTALELAIRMGFMSIYLFGADFSYPNGKSHATDTDLYADVDTSKMYEFKSVNGSTVYADSLFIAYREQIEEIISNYSDVGIYNMSQTGVLIKGAKKRDLYFT